MEVSFAFVGILPFLKRRRLRFDGSRGCGGGGDKQEPIEDDVLEGRHVQYWRAGQWEDVECIEGSEYEKKGAPMRNFLLLILISSPHPPPISDSTISISKLA